MEENSKILRLNYTLNYTYDYSELKITLLKDNIIVIIYCLLNLSLILFFNDQNFRPHI